MRPNGDQYINDRTGVRRWQQWVTELKPQEQYLPIFSSPRASIQVTLSYVRVELY